LDLADAAVDEDEEDDAEEKDVEDDPASLVAVRVVAAAGGVDNEVESVNPLPLDPLIDALSHRDPLLRSSRSIPDDDGDSSGGVVAAVPAIMSYKQKRQQVIH
jgi:hypothetical protein